MKARFAKTPRQSSRRVFRDRGSVLIIVLWIAFGLVSLALYFADSMNFELRASDNRVAGMGADEAIEGATRYLTYILKTQIANGSNGFLPVLMDYQSQAVPVGDGADDKYKAHYWLIGRDTNSPTGPGRLWCGLVDEASKLNLNVATSNHLYWLPRMSTDLTQAILDWRDTNASGPTVTYYALQQPSYLCKSDPFETVDELRLLYGADMDTLFGEDANLNGILDSYENDDNQNNQLDAGLLEYVTVSSREPNTNSSGSKINLSSVQLSPASQLGLLLQTNFGQARATQILTALGWRPGGQGGPGGGNATPPAQFASPLRFYTRSRMTSTEFSQISSNLTVSSASVVEGRVNVNSASLQVLTCLTGGDLGAAQTLVGYRQSNPGSLTSIAWLVDALGQNFPNALSALGAGDYLTTQSYQYTADVAALGPFGRGYRRVRLIFDTSAGAPQIVYRQDLTHLGWALGTETRQTWLLAKGTR